MLALQCSRFALLALAGLVLGSDSVTSKGKSSTTSHDLRSWLEGLVLPLPPFPLPKIKSLPILPDINVTGGNCTRLFVNSVVATNATNASAFATHFDVEDVSIMCTVDMVFDLFDGPVDVVADVHVNNLNLSMGLAIAHDAETPPLPTMFGLLHTADDAIDCSIQPGVSLKLSSHNKAVAVALELITQAIVPLINDIGSVVCPKVDTLLRNNVTNFVGGLTPILKQFLTPAPVKPPPPLPAVPGGDFVLNETQAGVVLLAMLADTLHLNDTDRMNTKLRSLAGDLLAPSPHKKSLTLIDNAAFNFGLHVDGDVLLDLGRVEKLNIAAQNTSMDLAVALQTFAIAFQGLLQFEATPVGLPSSTYECNIKNAAVNVSDLGLLLDTSIGIEKRRFDKLAFDQLLTKAGLESIVTYHEDGQLYNEGLEVLGLQLNVTPGLDLELAGKGVRAGTQAPLEDMLASSIDTLVWSLLDVYNPSITALINGALGVFGLSFINTGLAAATKNPPPVKDSQLNDGTWQAYMTSPFVSILPVAFFAIAVALVGGSGGRKLLKRAHTSQQQQPLARSYTERQSEHRQPLTSILLSGAVSRLTGFGVIALLLVNLFLFIPASSGRGTSLYINLTQDGVTSSLPAIHWSLMSSFHQMMNAQAYVLGYLVFIASGVWPYTKLLFLFGAMVVPPSKLASVGVRQHVLVLVDAVGKFSLLDSFFMFLYEALISARWENSDGSRKLSVSIEPDGGFILFFTATILCLLLGHVILILHRLSMHQDRPAAGSRGESFSLHRAAPRWLQMAMPPMLIVSAVLLPFGLFMTSLHTKVTGGLGLFYNLVDMDPNLDVSIMYVVTGPWRVLGYHTWTQLGWRFILTTLALLFVAILPSAFCISLFVLWFTPLRRKGRFAGIAVVQCLRAWSAMDICAFTVLVAWGFGPPFFRAFTSDPSQAFAGICGGIKDSFGANCFNLEASPRVGLVLAVIQSVVVLTASVLVSWQADAWLKLDGACEASVLSASSVHNAETDGDCSAQQA